MDKWIISCVIFGLCSAARFAGAAPVDQSHVSAELISGVSSISPGEDFWVGLKMTMEEGWHTYWRNSGDSGLPTKVTWKLPPGFEAGELHWPVPQRFDYTSGLTGYGYDGEVILLTRVKAPPALEEGTDSLMGATVKWLACQEICVPGKADLSLSVRVRASGSPGKGETRDDFLRVREMLPASPGAWRVESEDQGDALVFRVSTGDAREDGIFSLAFFPYRNDIINHAAQQAFRNTGAGDYELRVDKSSYFDGPLDRVQGVLAVREASLDTDQRKGIDVDIPVRH